MPVPSIFRFFKGKKAQNKLQVQFPELKRVEHHFQCGRLDEAMREIEQLEKKDGITEYGRLNSQILKSILLTQMEEPMNGLTLAEQVLKESQEIGNPLLIVDAIISKVTAMIELGDLDNCIDLIQNGETYLRNMESGLKLEVPLRDSTFLHLKGKVFRKKGNLNGAIDCLETCLSIKEELGNPYGIADTLNEIGIILASKGDFNSALKKLNQSLIIFKKLENKSLIVKILNNIGMIHWQKGELDQALENYQKSLIISEALGKKRYNAVLSLNIGLIYRDRGEFKSAFESFQKALASFKELQRKTEIAICLNNIGHVHLIWGEPDLALHLFQQSLEISEELGNKQEIAVSFYNIGCAFEEKGELETALAFHKKSLILSEEIGNNLDIAISLYNLVSVSIFKGSMQEAHLYLQKLQELNDREKNKLIDQRYRVAKANVLRMSDRIISRAEAQQIYQEVVQEEIFNIELTVVALLELSEVLLLELQTTGNEDVLIEVRALLQQLFEIAKDQHSYFWLANAYWLQSKLALMELDLERAQELLTIAQTLAKDKGLENLASMILSEKESLINQISQWEMFVEQKPPINDILKLTRLEDLLERMIYKKIYLKEEEVLEYAAKAKQLVERLEKD